MAHALRLYGPSNHLRVSAEPTRSQLAISQYFAARPSLRMAPARPLLRRMKPARRSDFAHQPICTTLDGPVFIIRENRTFDHVFATYVPVNKGESVRNLL
jgi:phospholipase C